MLKKIFENQLKEIFWDKDKSLMLNRWLPKDDLVLEEEIIREIQHNIEIRKKYMPKYIISNDSNRAFYYPPQIQAKIAKILAEALEKLGVLKFACVLPEELIFRISTTQLGEEATPFYEKGLLKFFDKEESALSWVNED